MSAIISIHLCHWPAKFKAFLHVQNLPCTAIDFPTISNFITFTHSFRHVRSSTIQTCLTGINFLFKLPSDNDCLALTHRHVSMLSKHLHKTELRTQPKRSPLTSNLLVCSIHSIRSGDISPSIDQTFECMFLLAFFSRGVLPHLPIPTYLFRPNSIISLYEPLTALTSHRYASNSTACDPLFVTETGNIATRHWFSQHLESFCPPGIPPLRYTIHSFHIGAASSATRAGVSDHKIQILGHWSSRAYLSYIGHNADDLRQTHFSISS